MPLVEKSENAMEYTSTQLIKLGIVVNVCTSFLNLLFLTSVRRMANAIGIQEVRSPRPLITKVFLKTSHSCIRFSGVLTIPWNQFSPTKAQSASFLGGR